VTSIPAAMTLHPQASAAQTMKEDPHHDRAAQHYNDRGMRRLLAAPPAVKLMGKARRLELRWVETLCPM